MQCLDKDIVNAIYGQDIVNVMSELSTVWTGTFDQVLRLLKLCGDFGDLQS
jgi:hypothetical protein